MLKVRSDDERRQAPGGKAAPQPPNCCSATTVMTLLGSLLAGNGTHVGPVAARPLPDGAFTGWGERQWNANHSR